MLPQETFLRVLRLALLLLSYKTECCWWNAVKPQVVLLKREGFGIGDLLVGFVAVCLKVNRVTSLFRRQFGPDIRTINGRGVRLVFFPSSEKKYLTFLS